MMSKPRRTTAILLSIPLLCALAPSAAAATFTYRGAAYISFKPDEYQLPESGNSLSDLAGTGANWASLLTTWYMDTQSSTAINLDVNRTPSDTALMQAISDMHARGLKVMLKPHVDVNDGHWRGTITPSDTNAWFASYNTFITHYAALAQAQGVDLFCIGCELKTMTGANNAAQWATVIQNIRAVYSGPLTYAANAFNIGDEYSYCSFWPLLDLAGLDVYCPLTTHNDPSVAELVAAWHHDFFAQDMVTTYRTWQAALNMPVIFTEIGYQSAQGTNITPYNVNVATAAPDQQEQANCYEAAFEVWSQEPWLQGLFWWGWEVPLPPANDADYSARGKLAQNVMKIWYSGIGAPPVFVSPLAASPSDADLFQSITFTATASDPDGDAVFYTWDFGDGSVGTDSPVGHAFAASGTYVVTVTASDGNGGVTSAQATVRIGTARPQPLTVTRAQLRLNFKKHFSDTLMLSGSLPLTTPLLNTVVTFNAGGVARTIQIDGKGHSPILRMSHPRKGKIAFTIALTKADLAAALSSSGFGNTTTRNNPIPLEFSLSVNNVLYAASPTLTYTARQGFSGAATGR